jgi:predicted lipoprotein
MSKFTAAAVCLLVALTGCKIVPTPKGGTASATQSDADLMAAKAEAVWKPQVLPFIDAHAKDFGEVFTALGSGVDSAGAKYGFRPADLGGGWNFVVRGTGVVVGANLESRAAKLEVDTTGDGKANLTIQIGPIVNGTALRDVLPFLTFTDFRDQIQFAKLARALNDMAIKDFARPTGDPVGEKVTFTGVFSYAGPDQPIALVPTALTLEPK